MTEVREVRVMCCETTVYSHHVSTEDRSRWLRLISDLARTEKSRADEGHRYPVLNDRPLTNYLELPADYVSDLAGAAEHHIREELVCDECGDRRVARGDKLARALDALAGTGVSEWPLSDIERILRLV